LLICFLSGGFYLSAGEGKTIEEIQAENAKKSSDEKKKSKADSVETKDSNAKAEDAEITEVPPFNEKAGRKIDILEVDPEIVAAYNEAVKVEKRDDIINHPQEAIKVWEKVVRKTNDNPFLSIGEKRLSIWRGYYNYTKGALEKNKKAKENIKKMLPIGSISLRQKKEAVLKYIETYSSVEGIDDILAILTESSAKDVVKKIIADDSFKEISRTVIKTRCENGKGKDCYTFSTLFEPGSLNEKKYLRESCDLDHNPACEKIQQIRKEEKELKEKQELEKQRKIEEEKERKRIEAEKEKLRLEEERKKLELERERLRIEKEKADKIRKEEEFKKLDAEKERKRIAAEKEKLRLEEEQKKIEQEKKELKAEAKAEKASAEPRKQSEFLKTHPYFWYGLSATVAGAVLGAVSISYGAKTNKYYSDYNDLLKEMEDSYNESYEVKKEYADRASKLLDDGDKFKMIAIGTGVAGGALIITGAVLMIVKKPKSENNLQLSFVPSEKGFMTGVSFSY